MRNLLWVTLILSTILFGISTAGAEESDPQQVIQQEPQDEWAKIQVRFNSILDMSLSTGSLGDGYCSLSVPVLPGTGIVI